MNPNETVSYPQVTDGVARRLDVGDAEPAVLGVATESGGGDLNGTAALIFFSHAGTGLGQIAVPRLYNGSTSTGFV